MLLSFNTLLLMSLGLILLIISNTLGLFGIIFFWLALNLITIGLAYGGLGVKLLGKKPNGKIAKSSLILLFPYFSLTWITWRLWIFIKKDQCCQEVCPKIWLGRKPFKKQIPECIDLIVDLTSEFPVSRQVKAGRDYICLPILDASVPSPETFAGLIQILSRWQGNIYIYCGQGNGRAPTVIIGYLIFQGIVKNVHEAETYLKKIRPSINLSKSQRQFLNKVYGKNPPKGVTRIIPRQ